ncbi:hypothetical protein quinque_003350 [Culex quinquefasciatus]
MIPRVFVLLGLFLVTVVSATQRSYDGFKVYNVQQETQAQADLLFRMADANHKLDFWFLSKRVGDNATVMVPPEDQERFMASLEKYGLQFSELIHNVESTHEEFTSTATRHASLPAHRNILTSYLRHADINAYLDELAIKHSAKVAVQEVGQSHEGRAIKTITINPGKDKVIFLDAGIHAREWIAPATALYVIDQLVKHSFEGDDALSSVSWVILPVVNPDGYEFSHEKDRFWRKTRRPSGNCAGTDGNRNFAFHWGEVGASASPCSDTYRGEAPFSEPETKVVREELLKLKGSCKFYLTLHSYGNYMLYPWGWTDDLPATWEDLDEVSQAGAAAIKQATGTRYTVGSSTNVLYAAAGGSDDWAFAEAEVPISITMELPGGGNSGFNPPPSAIEKIVKESWVGIRAMAEKVAEKY